MAEIYELDRTYGKDVHVHLKPGMAWVLYTDNGPGGPCGQTMRVTCPHSVLHVFQNEDEMRAYAKEGLGRNKKGRVEYGVVDEWSASGVFQVVIHEEGENESAGGL